MKLAMNVGVQSPGESFIVDAATTATATSTYVLAKTATPAM
jgi:hypothetical protein